MLNVQMPTLEMVKYHSKNSVLQYALDSRCKNTITKSKIQTAGQLLFFPFFLNRKDSSIQSTVL